MKAEEINKIIQDVNAAIRNMDYEKLMALKDIIDRVVEKDRFSMWLYDDEEGVKLRISKDFQQIELNEEECKEVLSQLEYAKYFSWKLPF